MPVSIHKLGAREGDYDFSACSLQHMVDDKKKAGREMRLICPNCDAQYEVVDDAIPADGRDVQCSNCGQTWFQHHPDYMADDADEPDLTADLAPAADTPVDDEERVTVPPVAKRRELDASVADILRQEAEREARAREESAGGLETQPDLRLQPGETETDTARRSREARERMARMRGEPVPVRDPDAEAAAKAAAIKSRRDLLPDIEEINSTLRSTGDRQSGSGAKAQDDNLSLPVPAERGKPGFKWGFILVVLLTIAGGAAYVFAPEIAQAVPQTDPYISNFVAQVDMARMWLDGQVTWLLTWLDTLASTE